MNNETNIKNGYVLLARVIQESKIWRDDPHVLKLFIYLIMEARQKKNPEKYPTFEIKRGELVTSLAQIAENNTYYYRTIKKWSRAKVSRMLNQLENQGYISILADTYGTHIRICNYNTYQNPKSYKRTAAKQQRNSSETVVRTNNNDNNVNNVNNDTLYPVENKPKPKKKSKVNILVQKWNEMASKYGIPEVKKISKRREKKLFTRMEDKQFEENFDFILEKISNSDFLKGLDSDWNVTFDWVIDNDNNYLKILEGSYDNKQSKKSGINRYQKLKKEEEDAEVRVKPDFDIY